MEAKATTLYNLLYLFGRIPGDGQVVHVGTGIHPPVQLGHLADARAATCVPEVQHQRTSLRIAIGPAGAVRGLHTEGLDTLALVQGHLGDVIAY